MHHLWNHRVDLLNFREVLFGADDSLCDPATDLVELLQVGNFLPELSPKLLVES